MFTKGGENVANEQNLRPEAHKLTAEEVSRGGKNSGKKRREQKKVKELLNTLLSARADSNPILKELAEKYGIERDESVKAVFTAICLINSAANGDLVELEKLAKLIEEYEPKAALDLNVTPFEDL